MSRSHWLSTRAQRECVRSLQGQWENKKGRMEKRPGPGAWHKENCQLLNACSEPAFQRGWEAGLCWPAGIICTYGLVGLSLFFYRYRLIQQELGSGASVLQSQQPTCVTTNSRTVAETVELYHVLKSGSMSEYLVLKSKGSWTVCFGHG